MKFTEHVVCCETSSSVHRYETDCWHRTQNKEIQVSVPEYRFAKEWQSLQNDTTAIILHGPRRRGVLHVERSR